jgi:hypothetical protein
LCSLESSTPSKGITLGNTSPAEEKVLADFVWSKA